MNILIHSSLANRQNFSRMYLWARHAGSWGVCTASFSRRQQIAPLSDLTSVCLYPRGRKSPQPENLTALLC